MAVMTGAMHELLPADVLPLQRDRRSRPVPPPLQVVRITSDSPVGAQLLLPAQPAGAGRIAPLLPVQRDRRSRRAAPVRRLTRLAVALGTSALVWLAIVGAVLTLGRTL